jgi:uncharacterized protein (DUF2062 family)
MTSEENQLKQEHFERIRRLKKFLRPLPRRTNIHRYPFLKWFAETARKRAYLWSLRTTNVYPALYAGSLISFLPIMGIQVPVAFLSALIFRANLPVIVALQFITNPVTFIPIYWTEFELARLLLGLLHINVPTLSHEELHGLLLRFMAGEWGENLLYLFSVFSVVCLGGIIVGSSIGLIGCWFYRMTTNRATAVYQRLKELRALREQKRAKTHNKPFERIRSLLGRKYSARKRKR